MARKKNAKHKNFNPSKKRGGPAKGGAKKSTTPEKELDNLEDRLLAYIDKHAGQAFSEATLVQGMHLSSRNQRRQVGQLLQQMAAEGRVEIRPDGKVQSRHVAETLEGTFSFVNPRFGFVIPQYGEEDIYIDYRDTAGALDGDKVEAKLLPKRRGKNRQEGVILAVKERSKTEFVGRLDLKPGSAFVIPDNRRMHQDIYIRKEDLMGAKDRDKVIVKITLWPEGEFSAEGKVVEVLGPSGDNDVEMNSIMAEFGLPVAFPEAVLKEAENIPTEITNEEIAKRRDMREVRTFTIDPVDAKDFDDALSLKELGNGRWEVGVHIADVSHYVKEGSILDREARHRATSVYLVDRTIPMLPEKLSNGLCSLRPNEEKLAFSAIFELDLEGKVYSRWFGRTVILSDRRFAYEEAQERLDKKEGDYAEELLLLNKIAHALRKDRFQSGSINFETVEVRFKMDETGKPLAVVPKVRQDAHKLIEDFMLLANKEVAKFGKFEKGGKERTFVYRIHDDPDPEKLKTFSKFASNFGYSLNTEGQIAKSYNKLMDAIEGKPEQNVLEQLAIRTMAKARYTTEGTGHFGLGFDHYTHFTSPIRRYPDVMVHRLTADYLAGRKSADKALIEQQCEHSSEMERTAEQAERASIKYKQVEFMSQMKGQIFKGIVSGIQDFGVFVEITETSCEGMIRINELGDDYYDFDPKAFRLVGRRNKRIVNLGQELEVKVRSTDLDRRTIDLDLVSFGKSPGR